VRRAAIVALAGVAAIAPLPPSLVERVYSTRLYLVFQPWVTRLSNTVGFSLLDVLIGVGFAMWILAAAARFRLGWLRGILQMIVTTIVAGAVVYLVFLVMWGLNYRRVPLADKLQFEKARVTAVSAREAARHAASELNRLNGPAHAAGWTMPGAVDPVLNRAFDDVQQELGATRPAAAGRPKTTILEPYFRRAGVSGMTDPFFLETLVDNTLLPFERPFVVAHEWAHLAGYGDEGEANFVGWITCQRGTEGDQYSGWLFLYEELAGVAAPVDRSALNGSLSPGVRRDLQTIRDRVRRNVNPTVAAAGWRAYDSYLKANRVENGIESYDTVVRLVLGVTFREGWIPLLR